MYDESKINGSDHNGHDELCIGCKQYLHNCICEGAPKPQSLQEDKWESGADRIKRIEAVYLAAKKTLTQEPSEESVEDSQYACPFCDGEGYVQGRTTYSENAAAGIQVFGIGDDLTALEGLIDMMVENIEWLIQQRKDLQALRLEVANSNKFAQEQEDLIDSLRNEIKRLKDPEYI